MIHHLFFDGHTFLLASRLICDLEVIQRQTISGQYFLSGIDDLLRWLASSSQNPDKPTVNNTWWVAFACKNYRVIRVVSVQDDVSRLNGNCRRYNHNK